MSQLSLVFFTVLAQSAVGLFIFLGLAEKMFKIDRKVMTRSFMLVLAILGLGALASVTHLGHPLRMFNVAFGLAHGSALSLEIVALSFFGGGAATLVAMRMFDFMTQHENKVYIASSVLGVIFILAIANVYTLATVPTWYSVFTPFQFLMTAAIIGPIASIAVLSMQLAKSHLALQAAENFLLKIAKSAFIIALLGYLAYLVWLGALEVSANPFEVVNAAYMIIFARVVLLVAGLFLWIKMRTKMPYRQLMLTSTALVLCSELLSRIFFYDVYISAGSGM